MYFKIKVHMVLQNNISKLQVSFQVPHLMHETITLYINGPLPKYL